jgi:FtsP/CotA-like multicopper oxidase with cupredoxin domain
MLNYNTLLAIRGAKKSSYLGNAGLTQPLVPAGGSFEYQFRVPDAGTYWYHSHNRSWEQVAKGLYGPLIIEENNPPRVDTTSR